MYFTHKTETGFNVFARARREGCSRSQRKTSLASNFGTEEIERSVSLLLRHEPLERELDGQVTLGAIDAPYVTLDCPVLVFLSDVDDAGNNSAVAAWFWNEAGGTSLYQVSEQLVSERPVLDMLPGQLEALGEKQHSSSGSRR